LTEPQRKPYPRKITVRDPVPVNDLDLTPKVYVLDQILAATQDIVGKQNVDAATTGALPANTRTADVLTADANGAFPTIDGVAPALDKEYLVKDEGGGSSHINDGIYVLTQLGDVSNPWKLTRRGDLSDGDHAAGAFLAVEAGTANGDKTFRCINDDSSDVVNTDALEFVYWGKTINHDNLLNVTSSQHHTRYADAEALAAAWANIDTKSPENLLKNGNFQSLINVNRFWTLSGDPLGCTATPETTIKKIGTQSIRLDVSGPPAPSTFLIYQDAIDLDRYKGRTVSFNCWMYCPSTNTQDSQIEIDDGVTQSTSSVCPRDDAWHLLKITHAVSPSATQIRAIIYLRKAKVVAAGEYIFADGAMLVEGDSCPAYGEYQGYLAMGAFLELVGSSNPQPIDADVATWGLADRSFLDGASGRMYLVYNRGTVARFVELSNEGVKGIGSGDSPYNPPEYKLTILCDCSGGPINIDMPGAADWEALKYSIKKIDSSTNAVTITTSDAALIDGQASYIISNQYDCVSIVSDGTDWQVLYPTGNGIPTGTSFPGSPSDGDLFNRTDLDMVFRYDAGRSKWLSEQSAFFDCGRGTVPANADVYARVGDATMSSASGLRMPRNGTIVAVTVENQSTVTRTIDFRVEDSTVNRVQLALSAAKGGKKVDANQDFSADNILQVLALTAIGNAMGNMIATIEVKWRA